MGPLRCSIRSPGRVRAERSTRIRFDRLNEHYRGVVGLARLVLRHSAFESGRGYVRASGFLMNMNDLFQEFVTVALREALGSPRRRCDPIRAFAASRSTRTMR